MVPAAAFLITMLLAQAPSAPGAVDLAAVRDLYVQAAYEEALSQLARVDEASTTNQIDQYRALCLLALGRTPEAEQALERIVARQPTYVMPDAEVSPRLVSLFHDVRERVLPSIAHRLYADAKTNFDSKQFAAAAAGLKQLMQLLGDPDLAAQASAMNDLKQLAQGFLQLASMEVAAAEKAAAAPPPPPAEQAVRTSAIVIYSSDDRAVKPPVEISRRMPPWNPPAVMARTEYRGMLEVVIDERGNVESTNLARPSSPAYDIALLDMARQWRYEPAQLDGDPVKYLIRYDILLAPRQ